MKITTLTLEDGTVISQHFPTEIMKVPPAKRFATEIEMDNGEVVTGRFALTHVTEDFSPWCRIEPLGPYTATWKGSGDSGPLVHCKVEN